MMPLVTGGFEEQVAQNYKMGVGRSKGWSGLGGGWVVNGRKQIE